MADPVRDLNNFLQGHPGGNLTREFGWASKKEGPEHSVTYHVTAVCKWTVIVWNDQFFTVTPVRGVNIGVGHGSSMGSAKRDASVQALEYLKSHGTGTSYSSRERR